MTDRQKEISDKLTALVSSGNSVLLEAVCGAGKTELVYQCIAESLKQGKTVGFAIPRRQVVLEIAERLQSVFTKLKVVAVCQGYTKDVLGDVIILTTHQLYRYNQYFDLLIIDEPDAFPFKGNAVLQGIAERSCRGVKVYLSATPDERLSSLVHYGKIKYLYLPKRPSGKDMIVPEVYYLDEMAMMVYAIYRIFRLVQKKHQIIVFLPTIKKERSVFHWLRFLFRCSYIDSKVEQKDEVIKAFKNKEYDVLLATTILERGITISGVSVIVLDASNGVFDEASLIQMAGRVGRNVKDPYGECIFLSKGRDEKIDQCVRRIVRANND